MKGFANAFGGSSLLDSIMADPAGDRPLVAVEFVFGAHGEIVGFRRTVRGNKRDAYRALLSQERLDGV